MSTFCTCGHFADDHRHRTGPCTGRCSYDLPCTCPSLEPDPNTETTDPDAWREQQLAAGHDMPPRDPSAR